MPSKDAARQKRLAEALRENLKRRKAALRERGATVPAGAGKKSDARPNTAKKPD